MVRERLEEMALNRITLFLVLHVQVTVGVFGCRNLGQASKIRSGRIIEPHFRFPRTSFGNSIGKNCDRVLERWCGTMPRRATRDKRDPTWQFFRRFYADLGDFAVGLDILAAFGECVLGIDRR